jgi:hypothetical protein
VIKGDEGMVNANVIEGMKFKIEFYQMKLKLRVIELLTNYLEKRLERRRNHIEPITERN